MLIKKGVIVLLLISVFAVGTMSFAETVEAAPWKKIDSGYIKTDGGQMTYTTYIKGSNKIKMNMKIKTKGKTVVAVNYLTKTKKGITYVVKDEKGKTLFKSFIKTKSSLKSYYNNNYKKNL